MEKSILLSDFYEFTMTQANNENGMNEQVAVYDLFFRKVPDGGSYALSGGLSEIIDYIKNLSVSEEEIEYLRSLNKFDEKYLDAIKNFKFNGDIYAIPDGTVVFPNEPLLTVKAKTFEAQILETMLLLKYNFGNLITTKASRITAAAKGRGVMEFGARRAHDESAAIMGAKYAVIGGCVATSNTLTGSKFDVNISGTMAHAYVQMFDTEYEAFLNYAVIFPNESTFLVDTYDTLNSGVVNAIRVAKEYLIPNGYRLKGIRLDSGDLAKLSIEARKMLDAAGLNDCKIVASNGLDEYLIKDLLDQGAQIDVFGVGERLITAKSDPVFGCVYKLVEFGGTPKIKLSEQAIKVTNPAHKKVIRFYDNETGLALGDALFLKDTLVPKEEYVLYNEQATIKRKRITNYTTRDLQVPIFINGELVYVEPTLQETIAYAKKELATLADEIKRFTNPECYTVSLDQELYELKEDIIKKERDRVISLKR